MLFSDFDIAVKLRDRGYDGQIAQIFARAAAKRGRLRTCVNLAEAVEVVAELIAPRGIMCDVTHVPSSRVDRQPANRLREHTSDPSVF